MVYAAVLGNIFGKNEERGVFRSKDGGDSWEKVLYIDKFTGAIQVEFDPNNPDVVYADMWEHQEGPWENARFSGTNSGLFKSVDGGTTWKQLTKGLPTGEEGRHRRARRRWPESYRLLCWQKDRRRRTEGRAGIGVVGIGRGLHC